PPRRTTCPRVPSPAVSGLPSPADLIGVVMGVGRVDLEPRLDAVGTALGVRPTSRPLLLGEPVEDVARRPPGGGNRLQRRLDRAVPVEEALSVLLLVVALDRRRVLGDQPPKPD